MANLREYGFLRVAALVPELKISNIDFNVAEIIKQFKEAAFQGAQIVLTPELSLTGYSCGDLFFNDFLIEESVAGLQHVLYETRECDVVLVIGCPIKVRNKLINCSIVCKNGEILGAVPKAHFDGSGEERYFHLPDTISENTIRILEKDIPFGLDLIFRHNDDVGIGIVTGGDVLYNNELAEKGANILLIPAASNETVGWNSYKRDFLKTQSENSIVACVYASAGSNESSADVVFGGSSMIVENGKILAENERFNFESNIIHVDINARFLMNQRRKEKNFKNNNNFKNIKIILSDKNNKLIRKYSATPFVSESLGACYEHCDEIFKIQSTGLAQRLRASGLKKCVIGLSGGLDSTLAFLVICEAFKKINIENKNIIAITMPGFGTTNESYKNACALAKEYGATFLEIPIKESVIQHFKDIGQDAETHDTTYENAQARERTQILMDIANKENALVIGTGDLSELALGWCTYNGDHMSMYAVNATVPKTIIKHLISMIAERDNVHLLKDIANAAASPELIPGEQYTEELIGPYELHDYFIYHFVYCGESIKTIFKLACDSFENEYSKEIVYKWLSVFMKRFFTQQFKRNCMPDGPTVGGISFSSRGGLCFPSDVSIGMVGRALKDIGDSLGR